MHFFHGDVFVASLSQDPLALMVEVRMPYGQKMGPQQGSRKAKVSNNGYRIVYVHLNDPVLVEHQKCLVQSERRIQGLHVNSPSAPCALEAVRSIKGSIGSRGCSPLAGLDFHSLLSSISEQTTFLRLLIDGREALRFDREVASSLAPLLLLGAIKVGEWLFSTPLNVETAPVLPEGSATGEREGVVGIKFAYSCLHFFTLS